MNGLLGVEESDPYRDCLFSNLGCINGSRSVKDIEEAYVNCIRSCQGDSLSEKIRNRLLSIGIPSSQLDALVEIMSEQHCSSLFFVLLGTEKGPSWR